MFLFLGQFFWHAIEAWEPLQMDVGDIMLPGGIFWAWYTERAAAEWVDGMTADKLKVDWVVD
jgi:nitric oxide synthase oxygenase domain/subunit